MSLRERERERERETNFDTATRLWKRHADHAHATQGVGGPPAHPSSPYYTHTILSLTMLHAWTLEHQHMMLCALRPKADTYEGRKPMDSWIRPPGRPRNVWLNKVQQDANALPLSTMWRPEIARGHGQGWHGTFYPLGKTFWVKLGKTG